MSFLEIKCLIIEGECVFPHIATVLFYSPLIILILILIWLISNKHSQNCRKEKVE